MLLVLLLSLLLLPLLLLVVVLVVLVLLLPLLLQPVLMAAAAALAVDNARAAPADQPHSLVVALVAVSAYLPTQRNGEALQGRHCVHERD